MGYRSVLALGLFLIAGCQYHKTETGCINPSFSPRDSNLFASDFQRLESPPHDNRLRGELAEAYLMESCSGVARQEINHHRGNNLICLIPGKTESKIVVGAHYDKTGHGDGVADNWSGIVLITRLAAELMEHQPTLSWELIAFGAEESDLLGSKSYIKKEAEAGDILAMINVDTLGLGKVNIDSRSDERLDCIASDLAELMNVEISNTRMDHAIGDWQPFSRKGVPVLNLHSLNRQSIKKVHTRKDRRQAISDNYLEDAWQILLNMQLYLDQELVHELAQELNVRSN
jgi:Iap family predicted aminopeptidase